MVRAGPVATRGRRATPHARSLARRHAFQRCNIARGRPGRGISPDRARAIDGALRGPRRAAVVSR
ncbi:hypothetical protein WT21_23535 [Burkholderia territorii]|nr:hypothetical protein WT21_23535 [Burkholderia territorii]